MVTNSIGDWEKLLLATPLRKIIVKVVPKRFLNGWLVKYGAYGHFLVRSRANGIKCNSKNLFENDFISNRRTFWYRFN